MFSNNLLAGVSGQGGGYTIDNSLRFNDNDSAYLSRTPASAGNRKTWTWSGWVKRGNIGTFQTIFSNYNGAPSNGHEEFIFLENDTLQISATDNNVTNTYVYVLNQVFRDSSGWYHLVVSTDTTNATASDRVKIYVNGQRITSFTTQTNPTQDYQTPINRTTPHDIGAVNFTGGGYYFDGYMADVNFIDGQALTADDFGEINATTGEWVPKKYSGTYGTNGFYLQFKNGAALGDDTSGNTNDWTPINLASTDQMVDTPTNNFAVLNPLDKSAAINLSEGNLKTTLSSPPGVNVIAYGTVGVSSGKWYMETTLNAFSYSGNGAAGISGMHDGSNRVGAAYSTGSSSWFAFSEGSSTALSFSGSAVGMVMQIAIDLDAGKLWVGKDGVWNGSGDPDTGANPDRTFTPSGTYKMSAEPYRDGTGYWLLTVNAGADSSFAGLKTRQGNTDANGIGDFYYTPPTGYLSLCTDNLPEPAIVDSETQFNVVTYTGDGNTGRAVTGVGFQPDFVWIKRRDGADGHIINDSVRGVAKNLFPFSNIAENTTAYLSSIDVDGFTLDIVANATNASGASYVAWCWKAGGTAVSNTDGSITSQVSANVDAGFSIVGYTGNSTSGATIGHGLNSAPEVVIAKTRTTTANWHVYTKETGAANVLLLDSTAALYTGNATWWNNTDPNSTVVTLGNGSGTNSSSAMIAYCFHSVESFSKFGSYVGNGSANGPFVYTGFRPAFVMIKRTDSSDEWAMHDSARPSYNPANLRLLANGSGAELSTQPIDLTANGFKVRSTAPSHNASGGTYIYMAFAEAPFKNAVAR